MALKCPTGFDKEYLRDEVRKMYDRVASEPDGDFHFHRGPEYAVEYLRYDRDELISLRRCGQPAPHRGYRAGSDRA